MRLSVVFELLLVFLFLAFAAARVIDPKNATKKVTKGQKTTALRQGPPNRYCACTSRMCNCCRDFSLPVVPIKGPGCASIMYVQRDTMMVTMSFGDRVLSNTTITGRTPKPICMTLPGGISQFCGRVYGISRKGEQFRACLGLELRALDDIEAALRVSCFKFGPKGVKLESAPPVPAETENKDPEEDEEDDYDDLDDDDDDFIGLVDDDDEGASSEDNEVDSDSVDYTGFSVLGEDILGTFFSDDTSSGSSKKKKANKQKAKPQVVTPKVSTTTKRPVISNIRRTTAKPVRVTKRPVANRVTKRPRPATNKTQIIRRPTVSVPTVAASQLPIQTTSLPSSPTENVDKNIVTKESITTIPTPLSTMQVVTMVESHEKVQPPVEVNQIVMEQTEAPVTFTLPTERIEAVKNEIRIPLTDLEKVEAVAAIAQQDVTSGVISSSSLTSEETEKPQEIVTVKYQKISPSYAPEGTMSYMTANTEKINSVKFVPTTVVTSRPSAEIENESASLDGIVSSEIAANSQNTATNIKNKISTYYQQSTQTTVNDNEEGSENESEEKTEDEEEEEEEEVGNNKVEQTSLNKKGNYTIINLKKQSIKTESNKDDDDNTDDDEDDDDILEGVLSDEEDNEEVEEEDEGDDNQTQKKKKPVNKNKVSADEEEDDSEEEILEESEETQQKKKPSKAVIKKKPPSEESQNEKDDEEDDEEDDILGALGEDDDEDEESEDDDDDDEDEDDDEKNKNKVTQSTAVKIKKPTSQQVTQSVLTKKPSTQKITQTVVTKKPITQQQITQTVLTRKPATQQTSQTVMTKKPVTQQQITQTILTKKPTTQQMTETILTQKPVISTEEVFVQKIPEEKITETATEKVFIYKQPEKITENVIVYQEPEKVFIYKEPVNKISEETTEKVFIYKQPVETFTQKYVFYKEPTEKITGKPVHTIVNNDNNKSSEEEESNEEIENDEENSSEEESDDENDSGKHTFVASIMKDRPVFSNKYAEEHDLTENDDIDIEDSEDENDFEDRNLKRNKKKPVVKSSVPNIKPTADISSPKILTLSDLVAQRKKFYDYSKDNKPISTSRTHRRMNLDRLLQV